MKKAAIIGYGTIAPVHLAAIRSNPEIELCAVCDTNEAVKASIPDGVPFYTDYKALCAEAKPDCVHICLPHYLHFSVSQYFAGQGVHVFCEKPVAMTPEEAEQFAAMEAAHPELKIGICLQNRLNETTETLKALLESGEYGKITGCRGFVPWQRVKGYYEEQPWRGQMQYAGGGCMINQSVHTLDLLYYLCGDIARLHATVNQLLEYGIEVEDTVVARLEFANGANGVFFATNANYTNESVQIRVATEKAVFHIEDDMLVRILPDGSREKLCENEKMPGAKFYFGASHSKLVAKFYRAIEQDTDDYIHVRDAVMSIRLIDAICRSSKANAVVEL